MANGLVLNQQEQWHLTQKLFAEGLFGIKEDPAEFITLKSGRKSPHYLDIRPGITDFSTRQRVAASMVQLTMEKLATKGINQLPDGYDFVAGAPEAMTSYAATIADQTQMPLLQPRANLEKVSGNKSPILGRYDKDGRVAEYDDVVTDGKTKIDTIGQLAASGLTVVDYFVVVDRQEGGAPQVTEATGVEITPALSVTQMTWMLRSEGLISVQQFDNVAEYLQKHGESYAQEAMVEGV